MISEPIIPGVSNVKDSLIKTEDSFRKNRTVSNSEIRKGPHCKIDKMREVLQNWFTPNNIPEDKLSKKNRQRYRGLVYSYMRDKNTTNCPSAFKPLIEEYLPFICKVKEEQQVVKAEKVKKAKVKEEKITSIGQNIDEIIKCSQQLKKQGAKELKIKFDEVEICLNMI